MLFCANKENLSFITVELKVAVEEIAVAKRTYNNNRGSKADP